MAKSLNGPYGHLTGKAGKLVHYMLKGQPIVRSVGVPSKKRSLRQKANQQAMGVIMELLRPTLRFINAGFELQARDTVWNPHNLAVSYNKRHALQGEYPNLSVNYSKVQFSTGTLPLAKGLKLEKEAAGVRISWDTTLQDKGDFQDDMVMVMAVYPAKKAADCILNITQRGTGTCFLPFRTDELTQIELYLAFKSSDGTAISETAYLGNLNGVTATTVTAVQRKNYLKTQARFKAIAANYFKQISDNRGIKPQHKRFLAVAKEYELLFEKLKDHPGKLE